MLSGSRPTWLTFDCYGTLIQWDEGLLEAVCSITPSKGQTIDPRKFIEIYGRHEHAIEQTEPHLSFRKVTSLALAFSMRDLGAKSDERDAATLANAISRMPPFPEVVATLGTFKAAGFGLCIISNTDDTIIAGNVAQLGGHVDRVVTAEQAGAYKPSHHIFNYAHHVLEVTRDEVVHVCASPHLDLVATRALGLRDVWIDRGTGRRPSDGYIPDGVLTALDGLPELFTAAGWL
jgi:2-haloacid dehalogenase